MLFCAGLLGAGCSSTYMKNRGRDAMQCIDWGIVTTKTIRRRFLGLPGRLTRSARLVTLHLPARWPWAGPFQLALARLRAIPIAA
jgi:hypothetical protein